jgi:hypothetical protein
MRLPLMKLVEAVDDSLAVVIAPSATFAVVTEVSAKNDTQAVPFQNSG